MVEECAHLAVICFRPDAFIWASMVAMLRVHLLVAGLVRERGNEKTALWVCRWSKQRNYRIVPEWKIKRLGTSKETKKIVIITLWLFLLFSSCNTCVRGHCSPKQKCRQRQNPGIPESSESCLDLSQGNVKLQSWANIFLQRGCFNHQTRFLWMFFSRDLDDLEGWWLLVGCWFRFGEGTKQGSVSGVVSLTFFRFNSWNHFKVGDLNPLETDCNHYWLIRSCFACFGLWCLLTFFFSMWRFFGFVSSTSSCEAFFCRSKTSGWVGGSGLSKFQVSTYNRPGVDRMWTYMVPKRKTHLKLRQILSTSGRLYFLLGQEMEFSRFVNALTFVDRSWSQPFKSRKRPVGEYRELREKSRHGKWVAPWRISQMAPQPFRVLP